MSKEWLQEHNPHTPLFICGQGSWPPSEIDHGLRI